MVTACSTFTNNTIFEKSRTADIAVIDLKVHTDVICHFGKMEFEAANTQNISAASASHLRIVDWIFERVQH